MIFATFAIRKLADSATFAVYFFAFLDSFWKVIHMMNIQSPEGAIRRLADTSARWRTRPPAGGLITPGNPPAVGATRGTNSTKGRPSAIRTPQENFPRVYTRGYSN